ncbi:hypothetical protein [Roseateles sp. MS654]|uniref:hypothetical protein n=1 Tax=Roseateles sp. MS654 TaxID=3412685 RepID=UPI003C2D639F
MPSNTPSTIASSQPSIAQAEVVERSATSPDPHRQAFLNQLSERDKQIQTGKPPVAPPRRLRQVKKQEAMKQEAAALGRAAETSAATGSPAMIDISAMREVRPMKKTRAPEPPSPSSLATAKEPLLPARAAPQRPPPPRLSPARRLARLRQRIAAAMPRPVVHAWQALSGMVRDVFRPLFAGRA